MCEEAYTIEDLDDCDGLSFSHPQKCIISVLKDMVEPLNVLFRVRIEFCELFEYRDVWDSVPQEINECGYLRPFVRLVGQRRLNDLPKVI